MDADLDGLPTLTPKQTVFLNGLLAGNTSLKAYTEAYDCKTMSQGAISVEASRLRRNPKIAHWLRHYQRIGLEAGLVSFEGHLSELARGRELAIAHGQIAASVQAEHWRGKAAGFYENQMRLTVEPSDEELLKEVERLLGKETAEAIAAAFREQFTA